MYTKALTDAFAEFQPRVEKAEKIIKACKLQRCDPTKEQITFLKSVITDGKRLTAQKAQEDSDNSLRGALNELGNEIGMIGPEGKNVGQYNTGQKGRALPGKVRASGGSGDWAKSVADYSDRLTGGMKSLIATGNIPVTVPLTADPVREGVPVLSLRQLIPLAPGNAPYWSYLRQTTRTNNASTVAVGKKKPTSSYQVTRVENRLHTIAHLSEPIPNQLLSDASALQVFLEAEMRLGVELELEDQIVNGAGSTTGVLDDLTGIDATSGTQSQAWSTDEFITTRKAITLLENSSIAPTGWVMNPNSWERFELSADTTDRFMLGNAPVDRAARRLWGLPVVLSTVVADNKAFLADWGTATALHVGEEGTLTWTEAMYRPDQFGASAPGSDFEANTTTFRFEGRFGLDVLNPFAIVDVDLTSV
ncbi:MAG TPA: phage major capsid protein [Spirillospora sp.]|nr:phage major capsid protein [Spirillospora sp.]